MSPPIVTVACRAMATRFEIALWGGRESDLRAAGREALEEIQRLEAQLSLYRPDSDLCDLNARAAFEPVPMDPRLFRLLERAAQLSAETDGAFDITIAPLLRAWGFVGGTGGMPDAAEVAAARDVTGMNLVALDAENFAVRFLREGVTLDLGAIGKGYAIERAADILRECGIGGALIHGGTSTVQAIGTQPDGTPWPVAIQHPTDPDRHLAVVSLRDNALSISAVHGKSFTQENVRYGHVLDPRTGTPVQVTIPAHKDAKAQRRKETTHPPESKIQNPPALLAAVVCPSATDSDAFSTALLVLGESFLSTLCARPETGALIAAPDSHGDLRVQSQRME